MPVAVSSNGSFRAPDGKILYKFVYPACKKGHLQVCLVAAEGPLRNGVHERCWWSVTAEGLPVRHFRTCDGYESVKTLISMYGIMDRHSCLNIGAAELTFLDASDPTATSISSQAALTFLSSHVPERALARTYGIPQREPNSGICWYAALMFSLFHCPDVASHVSSFLPDDLKRHADKILTHPSESEEFRRKLWETYRVGDKYGQDPWEDGQNGVTQFFVMAGRIGIPIKRYFVDRDGMAHKLTGPVADQERRDVDVLDKPPGGASDPMLLAFRFRRGAHGTDARLRPPRRKVVCGRRYRLFAMMIGSEHCGHQIAACASGPSWRQWGVCDSDAQRQGIGVTHWSIDEPNASNERWWDVWKHMVPTVKFSGGYCNLSPQNTPSSDPTAGEGDEGGGGGGGLTNVDFLYFSPAEAR